MSNKYKKVCTTLIFIENFLMLASAVTGCFSVFILLLWLVLLKELQFKIKVCAVTAGINKLIKKMSIKQCQ